MPASPGNAEDLDLAIFKRSLGCAPPARCNAEGGLCQPRRADLDHSESYRRARAASTRRRETWRAAQEPASPGGVDEVLDLDIFKRSLGCAPPARFDAQGGFRSGSPNDWEPWGIDLVDLDHSERTILDPGLRRPAARRARRERASERRSGRSWLSWLRRPRMQAESAFNTVTWEARARQRQVDDAMRATVVLLIYSAFAFCWWFVRTMC